MSLARPTNEDEFSYSNLNQKLVESEEEPKKLKFVKSRDKRYVASIMPREPNFIGISYYDVDADELEPCEEGKFIEANKLKFHISLPENNSNMFEKGWAITKNILMNHNVNSFKIIKAGIKMSDEVGQEGKDITIYAYFNPEKDIASWELILKSINQQLIEAGVTPGRKPSGVKKEQKAISGSDYITYRYERKWPTDDICAKIALGKNLADKKTEDSSPSISMSKQ